MLSLDGVEMMRRTTTGTTFWYMLDTSTAANGDHQLTLAITDANGRTATAHVAIRVTK